MDVTPANFNYYKVPRFACLHPWLFAYSPCRISMIVTSILFSFSLCNWANSSGKSTELKIVEKVETYKVESNPTKSKSFVGFYGESFEKRKYFK